MKYALTANIEISLPAKADESVSAILLRVVNKPLWTGQENRVDRGKSESGNPTANIELRFEKLADRDELANYLKDLRDRLPFLSGVISIHNCYHDEGGRSCDNWQDI